MTTKTRCLAERKCTVVPLGQDSCIASFVDLLVFLVNSQCNALPELILILFGRIPQHESQRAPMSPVMTLA